RSHEDFEHLPPDGRVNVAVGRWLSGARSLASPIPGSEPTAGRSHARQPGALRIMRPAIGYYIDLPIGNRRYGGLPVGGTVVVNAIIIPLALALSWLLPFSASAASVIFETTSPYHHIRVVDDKELRTLCFDDGQETRMSLRNPLVGHFEYT